ncbi:MAG: hypothetical protein Q8K60_05690 [Parachlamydiaceae bacterium]|nr:hypothetical protein [Parachlamydiaceae bacterium]
MKKIQSGIFAIIIGINSLAYGASLNSLDKEKIENALVNKTLVSIGTDNLNGKTIENTFSMYLDNKGNILGKMGHKPVDEPQNDKGVYIINDDGSFSITWEHWDGAKQISGHLYETENAYISIDDQNVFHTAFMKESIKTGNHLN